MTPLVTEPPLRDNPNEKLIVQELEDAGQAACFQNVGWADGGSRIMSQTRPVRTVGTKEERQPLGVDTALLLEELKRQYGKSHRPVEVSFREIVSWARTGDQHTHFIHPYPAKLLPHIANFFASASTLRRTGARLLDPFAGSGTVALEASLAGLQPLVADANPLALLITQVKTTAYDLEALLDTLAKILSRASRIRSAPEIPIVNEALWYEPRLKRELERVLRAVMEVEDGSIRDFFRVCFSVAARRLSNADLSISVPVRLRSKPHLADGLNSAIEQRLTWLKHVTAVEEFGKIAQLNISRVAAANRAFHGRRPAIEVGRDARDLVDNAGRTIASGSVPLVITSPPYGSAQKYVRASSLSLNWLSLCSPLALATLEAQSIGREHLPRCSEPPSSARFGTRHGLEDVIEKIRCSKPERAAITETYLRELRVALREISRVTEAGGHVVLIVGNNTVAGQLVRNDKFVKDELRSEGFVVELEVRDRIHSRGLLTRRHSTAGVITKETVLLFRKKS